MGATVLICREKNHLLPAVDDLSLFKYWGVPIRVEITCREERCLEVITFNYTIAKHESHIASCFFIIHEGVRSIPEMKIYSMSIAARNII